MDKRILIISNGAISDTDSNGRTIARLFDCFSKAQKAQFFTYGDPDFSQCGYFYKVSDNDALHSFLQFAVVDGTLKQHSHQPISSINEKPAINKSPFVLLIREAVWKLGLWRNRFLKEWIDEVDPVCIFLYLGDNFFTIDLAIRISKSRRIPIVVYSTEEYPFKNYNYITKRRSLIYSIWHWSLKKNYNRLAKYASLGLFNSHALTSLYSSAYRYPCRTLYQSSDIDFCSNYSVRHQQRISYLGNLRLNRHKALIDIAKALAAIDSSLTLDIYGNPDEQVKVELERQSNIILHGFISYEDVIDVIHRSTLLVHAECSDIFYNRDLKYAFSTKITDSVCSGTPLFMYTPNELACTEFVLAEGCSFHAERREELSSVLRTALFDEESRKTIVNNAWRVKEQFFTNHGALKTYIEEVVNAFPQSY